MDTGSTVSAATLCAVLALMFMTDLPGPEIMKFGIESKYSCATTSTAAFKAAIYRALLDMRDLCRNTVAAQL